MLPNIVVVILDEIGADSFEPSVMPLLNAWASMGVYFTRNTVAPSCSPTRAAMLTGLLPPRTGVGITLSSVSPLGLDPAYQTLPRVLAANGYRCDALGKWGLRNFNSTSFVHPIQCGFDSWEGLPLDPNSGYTSFTWCNALTDSSEVIPDVYLTTYETDKGIERLSGIEPFFLWMAYNDAHAPFHCPPAELHSGCGAGTDIDHFRAQREALDKECDRFLRAVNLATTTVWVVSDNGTPRNVMADSPYPTTHLKGSAFAGGTITPLFVLGAGVSRAGVCHSPVHACDLPATVLEWIGLPNAMPEAVDSVSYAQQITDPGIPGRACFTYTEGFAPNGLPLNLVTDTRAAENYRYRLVRNGSESDVLFDVLEDPYELAPLDLTKLRREIKDSYDLLKAVLDANGLVDRRFRPRAVRLRTKARRSSFRWPDPHC
jgi:arylsulfatase A-like enzyme